MRYSIFWSKRALDALTEIWLVNPGQRDEIRQAATRIDQLLLVNPNEQGESRGDDSRILIVQPIVARFVVDEVDSIVRVLEIRYIRHRRSG